MTTSIQHCLNSLELMDKQPFQVGQLVWWETNVYEFRITGIRQNDDHTWETQIKFTNYPDNRRWWVPSRQVHPFPKDRAQMKQVLKAVN